MAVAEGIGIVAACVGPGVIEIRLGDQVVARDFGMAEARTTYGVIGVKVWIFKGEVFDQPEPVAAPEHVEAVAPAQEQPA